MERERERERGRSKASRCPRALLSSPPYEATLKADPQGNDRPRAQKKRARGKGTKRAEKRTKRKRGQEEEACPC
jgi:hypothetical protein